MSQCDHWLAMTVNLLTLPVRVGEVVFNDEIPFVDEIQLEPGWVDLISSERSEDFIDVS